MKYITHMHKHTSSKTKFRTWIVLGFYLSRRNTSNKSSYSNRFKGICWDVSLESAEVDHLRVSCSRDSWGPGFWGSTSLDSALLHISVFLSHFFPCDRKKRLQRFHTGERTRSTLPQTINQQSLPHYDRTNGDQSLKPGDCFTGLSQMMPSVHQSVVSWLQFTGICCLYLREDYTCPTSLTPALAITCSGRWHWNTNYQHSSSESDIAI